MKVLGSSSFTAVPCMLKDTFLKDMHPHLHRLHYFNVSWLGPMNLQLSSMVFRGSIPCVSAFHLVAVTHQTAYFFCL